jgi:hypothetical protein
MKEKEIVAKLVEYFNKENNGAYTMWQSPSYKNRRWDIFNCFDVIIAFHDYRAPFYIQITSLSNLSHRRRKIENFFNTTQAKIANCYVFAWNDRKQVFKIEKMS